MRHLLFFLLLSGATLAAHAGVYTYIDAEGNRVFTDQPPSENAQRLELAPSNEMRGQATIPRPPPVSLTMEPKAPAYDVLRILIPEPDVTIRDVAGNLIVTATLEPALQEGHLFRLVMDGKVIGEASRSPVFPLENVDRGTHQIAIEVIDTTGRTLERTPSQPFHMKRISLAQKRQANPCKKDDYGVRPECPLKYKPKEPRNIPFVPFI